MTAAPTARIIIERIIPQAMHLHLLRVGLSALAILAAIPLATIGHAQPPGKPQIRDFDETIDSVPPPVDPRTQVVQGAYTAGAALYPAAAAVTSRSGWERAAYGSGLDHAALVQAFVEIAVTYVAYEHLLNRSASAAELQQRIVELKGYKPWTVLWRELATSPERDQRFGHFAPATMSQNEAQVLYQLPRLPYHGEQCFGGLGDRCDGGLPGIYTSVQPRWIRPFSMPDGTQMGYVEIGVAVGSILHDNACVDAGTGVSCMGFKLDEDWTKTSGQPAAMEWNKAVWNVLDGRTWRAVFGPYPMNAGVRRYSWYDDLRPVPARASKMGLVLGPLSVPVHTEPYRGAERKMSARLSAPTGTPLDVPDPEFCQSRSFSSIVPVLAVPPKWQGVCR